MRFIPLFSGSSGNCSVIQTEKATLLVDAGLTGKAVCGALASAGINPASVDGILVTHDTPAPSEYFHASTICPFMPMPAHGRQ